MTTREIQRAALEAYGENDVETLKWLNLLSWAYCDVFASKMCRALKGRLEKEGPIEMNYKSKEYKKHLRHVAAAAEEQQRSIILNQNRLLKLQITGK